MLHFLQNPLFNVWISDQKNVHLRIFCAKVWSCEKRHKYLRQKIRRQDTVGSESPNSFFVCVRFNKKFNSILSPFFQIFHFRVDQENRLSNMFPQEVLPQMFANIKSIYKFHAEFLLPQVSLLFIRIWKKYMIWLLKFSDCQSFNLFELWIKF